MDLLLTMSSVAPLDWPLMKSTSCVTGLGWSLLVVVKVLLLVLSVEARLSMDLGAMVSHIVAPLEVLENAQEDMEELVVHLPLLSQDLSSLPTLQDNLWSMLPLLHLLSQTLKSNA